MALFMCGKLLRDWFQTSDHRGRTCVVCHSGAGRLGTLRYNSFNRLSKAICMLSSCSVVGFKS